MIIEWTRSSYQGTWALFRDSADTNTVGRYYFAANDTPHFNGFHNLGSRRWHDANWPAEVRHLGERMTTPELWDDGSPPVMLPLPRAVGSLDAIRNGQLLINAAPPGSLIDGFPAACFQAFLPNLQFGMLSSFDRCATQRVWARVIEWLYLGMSTQILDLLNAWLGPTMTYTYNPGDDVNPAIVMGISAECCFVAIDGTNTFQQFALQAFDLIQEPQNFGILASASTWYHASTWVHERLMDAGQQAGTPIFIAGHSYGGCVGLILAARYRAAAPARVIRYLTYGAPKIGNQAAHNLLAACEGVNLANDDDLVTVLPPDLYVLIPVALLLGVPILFRWTDWIRQPNQVRMDSNGALFPNALFAIDFVTLLAMAEKALASESQNPIAGHVIEEYYARITTRCPGVEWPITEQVKEMLEVEPIIPGGDCTQAPSILPFTYTGEHVLPDGEEHWFRFPIVAAQQYFVRITFLSGTGKIRTSGFRGDPDDCTAAALWYVGAYATPGVPIRCNDPTAAADEWAFIRVNGESTVGPNGYRIEIGEGAC